MTYEVAFVYTDELLGEDGEHMKDDEQTEIFPTRAEAEAFKAGLEWGDEPKFTVVGINEK